MDIVYAQPLKELLQLTTFFKEETTILITNELQETKAKQRKLIPCYLVDKKTDVQKLKGKKKAVVGGSVQDNELAVKVKADYLLQPSNTKQFFDLGLAKKLAENGTIVVLMFEELLGKNSFERHLYWKNYLEVVRYCKKKNVEFFVVSGCKDPLNLKAPKIRECIKELLEAKK
jgi:RNase P/RNase MRP subunit p30